MAATPLMPPRSTIASPADLAAALARNVYGAAGPEAEPKAEALAQYIRFA